MVFAVTFFAVFHMLPQVPAHDVEQRMRTRVVATRWDELGCGTRSTRNEIRKKHRADHREREVAFLVWRRASARRLVLGAKP